MLPVLNFYSMHRIIDNFPIDPVFDELYRKNGGFDKALGNDELQKVYDQFNVYLTAKYKALSDEIKYKFDAKKFEPEPIKMTAPLVLSAGNLVYSFKNYQVLQNTILMDICFPVANSFDTAVDGKNILQFADLCKCFLTLTNDRQQKIVDREPVIDYIRDTAYWQGKGKFDQSRIDWTTSQIEFAAGSTIPTTKAGYVILPVLKYLDMKRYPYLNSK
jgi:hypothetical protein